MKKNIKKYSILIVCFLVALEAAVFLVLTLVGLSGDLIGQVLFAVFKVSMAGILMLRFLLFLKKILESLGFNKEDLFFISKVFLAVLIVTMLMIVLASFFV